MRRRNALSSELTVSPTHPSGSSSSLSTMRNAAQPLMRTLSASVLARRVAASAGVRARKKTAGEAKRRQRRGSLQRVDVEQIKRGERERRG